MKRKIGNILGSSVHGAVVGRNSSLSVCLFRVHPLVLVYVLIEKISVALKIYGRSVMCGGVVVSRYPPEFRACAR